MTKQKQVFLDSEGDAWYARNADAVARRELPGADPVLKALLELPPGDGNGPVRLLEIGCGDGTRLHWLQDNTAIECIGIDPSGEAVAAARAKGVNAQVGTADELPFDAGSFSIVVYGFCLYLCDREDLFQIAREADRVLANPGWLLILDFHSAEPAAVEYHHRPGLKSFKMDYRTLFTWHPSYHCLTHTIRDHADGSYTDRAGDWVAMSVLRKHVHHAG